MAAVSGDDDATSAASSDPDPAKSVRQAHLPARDRPVAPGRRLERNRESPGRVCARWAQTQFVVLPRRSSSVCAAIAPSRIRCELPKSPSAGVAAGGSSRPCASRRRSLRSASCRPASQQHGGVPSMVSAPCGSDRSFDIVETIPWCHRTMSCSAQVSRGPAAVRRMRLRPIRSLAVRVRHRLAEVSRGSSATELLLTARARPRPGGICECAWAAGRISARRARAQLPAAASRALRGFMTASADEPRAYDSPPLAPVVPILKRRCRRRRARRIGHDTHSSSRAGPAPRLQRRRLRRPRPHAGHRPCGRQHSSRRRRDATLSDARGVGTLSETKHVHASGRRAAG